MIVSASLDFGSTRFKAALLSEDGALTRTYTLNAPPMARNGLICEGDPIAYYSAATELLKQVCAEVSRETPIGIASQRSSFLLWDKETGHPETPLISWQDRRAQEWCNAHRYLENEIQARTGLPLSPHYVGPKLAYLFMTNPNLKRRTLSSRLLFGTLETWLLWKWTNGQVHETDFTMAARTLLVDLKLGTWSDDLLNIFGIPHSLLPAMTPTAGNPIPLELKGLITVTIADQAASGISVIDPSKKSMVVNLGTGGFVINPTGENLKQRHGYLSAPLLGGLPGLDSQFALEGTMNGIANALSCGPKESTSLMRKDPYPHCYCSPETSGLGSPYWQAAIPFLFSKEPPAAASSRRRLILEGIVFRVCGIIHDLWDTLCPWTIYLAGGLSQDPFIYRGLALCLKHPIYKLREKEITLLATARLAAGLAVSSTLKGTLHHPSINNHYLQEKYGRWKKWLEKEIYQHK